MPENPSDRIGAFDEAYIDFEVWSDDGERVGLSGPLYLTHNDRPEFVSARFPDEGTMVLIPFGAAEIDEELSMIRLDAPAHVVRNGPRMRDDDVPEAEYVRNVIRHFDVAHTLDALGPADTTSVDLAAADPTAGEPTVAEPPSA